MADSARKKIPIGNEFFEELRNEGYYYVDKTGFICDLLQNGAKVCLFTRPRRFGKTLNMSMLKAFFEIGCNPELFKGLEIAEEKSICEEYMGKFPVLFLSLKDVGADSYLTAQKLLVKAINEEARRQKRMLDSRKLLPEEKDAWDSFLAENMDEAGIQSSLRTLTELLYQSYGQKAIVLIDEYDVPLAKAFEQGYYDSIVPLIRGMFSQVLKTNASLQFAVLTGCLRISKESIFTGLNNIVVYSIADVEFSQYFGFTDSEVHKLLEEYNLTDCYRDIKEWYDGYHFGNTEVYCPWDVLYHCHKLCVNPKAKPKDYWINTSGNDIIQHFLEKSDVGTAKREIEQLMEGKPIEKNICQELTYRKLYDSMENLWSVLFAAGYLTQRGNRESGMFQLAIPNREIHNIFSSQIMEHFQEKARKDGAALEAFCIAFQNGDAAEVEQRFRQYLKKTISIRDNAVRNDLKENFYHGILLGLLSFKEDWVISSNRDSGKGYSDILVELEEEQIGIVIELKHAGKGQLEAKCQEALEQIERNKYDECLRAEGMEKILKYGIACEKKNCKVMLGKAVDSGTAYRCKI